MKSSSGSMERLAQVLGGGLKNFCGRDRVGNMKKGKIIIPAGRRPWLHELRVANILALAGHTVKFLEETNMHTADILLNGVEYEIKSPFTKNGNIIDIK